ncbi:MAG: flagellar basal body rod protein FlgB [Desulfurivibrio sp.]|nr:flagellar basal body rod protein FlgB [Desulfurivibrio sp.]MBU3937447.1 flagellar basal body rod protein FlgB [Pseudomonadota bacterium]MBU4119316.1 flagellar basal body rod protein FlgB [Pseudomonadota bacterium]
MPVNKLFGGNIEIMRQALTLRQERHGLIQSNVANYETPGYTVQDFNFAKVMESVIAGQGELARTNKGHMQLDAMEASKTREFASEKRPVDLDEEMVKMAENQLMFQAIAKIIGKKFVGIRYAIDEGGK